MRLGVEATAVDPERPSLTVREVGGGYETELVAKWIIAADGASSTVRRFVGIDFVDQGFDQEWLVVDATALVEDFDFPRIPTQVCSPERVVTLIPGHGTRRRWEFQLHGDETRAEFEDPDRIAELLAPWGSPEEIRLDRTAVYRFHALVAERFRSGNVFLAGDAAHQMPPFNGQGMCSGIRDAQNLAWRLSMVSRGQATDALLDTYDAERRPHSAQQVEHSAAAGKLIDALAAGVTADTAAGYGGDRPFPHLEHGLLDGDHPAVGRQVPQPTVDGEPFDDRLGDHFTLLSRRPIDRELLRWWSDRGAESAVVPAGLFDGLLDDDTCVIVRPDRYVTAVTEDLAVTTARLAPHFGETFP
jgi:3-(3-hydroxy-phenyl)propionate hydroxylase